MKINDLRKINIDKFCNEVIYTFLPKGTKDKVIVFNFDIAATDYTGSENRSIRRLFQIAFYAPNNYIRVGWKFDKDENFTHVANHDSSWRDGANRSLKEVIKSIEKECEEKGYIDVSDLTDEVYFSHLGIEQINGYLKFIPEGDNDYIGEYSLIRI